MKIGLYIFSLALGGAERFVSRLSNILEAHGHSVYVILDDLTNIQYEHSGTLLSLDIPHNVHGLQAVRNIFARKNKLQQLKKQYNFDSVVSFLFLPNIVNIFSKTKNCKTYISIRNHFLSHKYDSISSLISYILAKKYYKKTDGVICVSELIKQDTIKYLHIKAEKVFVLYNSYDIAEINKKAAINESNKFQELNDPNLFTFVSTGRHVKQKAFWHLIKAFSLLAKQYENIRLVLIGDGDYRQNIEILINDLRLNEKVILTGLQKNVFPIEKKSNVYVMTSLFEGFPNALVEAMCLGLPIISTDCKSGPREILAPGININITTDSIEKAEFGILVPPLENDVNWNSEHITNGEQKLAEAMRMMMEEEKTINFYSAQSLKRAQVFSFDVCYETFINIVG